MPETVETELRRVIAAWDDAMITNVPADIARYMADDWQIIGADGSGMDKATFLGMVTSGALTHHVMESLDATIRVYGETAVVTARGISAGTFEGRSFRFLERASTVFVRSEGRWTCVHTHLSDLGEEGASSSA